MSLDDKLTAERYNGVWWKAKSPPQNLSMMAVLGLVPSRYVEHEWPTEDEIKRRRDAILAVWDDDDEVDD